MLRTICNSLILCLIKVIYKIDIPPLSRKGAPYRPSESGMECVDIAFIPMRRGFMFLFAIMDWHSRKIPAWELSIPGFASKPLNGL